MLFKWQKDLVKKALSLKRAFFPFIFPNHGLGKTTDETAVYLKPPRLRVLRPIEEPEHFGTPIIPTFPNAEDRMHRRGRPAIIELQVPNDSEIIEILKRKKEMVDHV
jgi:hypothetical protein